MIHVNVRQKPLQYCKVISLQLIKNKWGEKKLSKVDKATDNQKQTKKKIKVF